MDKSMSLCSLLGRVLSQSSSDDSLAPVDDGLFRQAVMNDYFKEAQRLFLKGYPKEDSVSQVILYRLQIPVKTHQEDFCSLLLTLMFNQRELGQSLELNLWDPGTQIPEQNTLFVLLIFIYEKNKGNAKSLGQKWSAYFSSKPGKKQFSLRAAWVVMQQVFEKMAKDFNLPNQRPSTEFLISAQRKELAEVTEKVKGLCVEFHEKKMGIEKVAEELRSMFWGAKGSQVENVAEVAHKHSISMTVARKCSAEVDAWLAGATAVLKIIGDGSDTEACMEAMFQRAMTPVPVREACFLVEAYALAQGDPIRGPRGKPGPLEQFAATLKHDAFREMCKSIRPGYSVCVDYPPCRQKNMHNLNSETGKILLKLGKTLLYARYLACASVVESLDELNRIAFVRRMMPSYTPDTKPKLDLLDVRVQYHQKIAQTIADIAKKFKGLAFVNNLNLADLELDADEYRPWQFSPETGLASLSPSVIDEIRINLLASTDVVTPACDAIRYRRTCPHCGRVATIVCENCKCLVACTKCRDQGCPKCNKPL